MTQHVIAFVTAFMYILPVVAAEPADQTDLTGKIVGTWAGDFRHKEIDALLFSRVSFNLEIDGCEVSGSYKINSNDELLLTPRAIDRTRQGSPTFCSKEYPEFVSDKELNLGKVEFVSDNKILLSAGRLNLIRLP